LATWTLDYICCIVPFEKTGNPMKRSRLRDW